MCTIELFVLKERTIEAEVFAQKTVGIDVNFAGADFRKTQEKTAIPTQNQQEITPNEGYLLSKVTVEPIPQNYGLITYNGYSIMVS